MRIVRLRIEGVRIELLTIAVNVPPEPKKNRPADPSSVPAAIATKAQIAQPGPLARNVGLVVMRTDPQTVPPDGNPPEETTLVVTNHVVNPLAVAATKRSMPHAPTEEVAMIGMIVLHAMIAPHAGTQLIAAGTRQTLGLRGRLHLAPHGVSRTTVPRVATRLNVAATVMRTPLDQPALTLHARSQAVAMIALRAEIVTTAPPTGTVTTVPPAVTMPHVRIVDQGCHRAAPNRASLPPRAVIGTRRGMITTKLTRPAPSLRRSMLLPGNMPSRCSSVAHRVRIAATPNPNLAVAMTAAAAGVAVAVRMETSRRRVRTNSAEPLAGKQSSRSLDRRA